MNKIIFRKYLTVLLLAIIFASVLGLLSFIISLVNTAAFPDILFVVAMLVTVFGCFAVMRGNLRGCGRIANNSSQTAQEINNQTTGLVEQAGSDKSFGSYFKESIIKFSFWRVVVLLGGAIAVIFVYMIN